MAEERSTNDLMREGMTLTLEWMELKRKKVNRTITDEEKERFLELDGYLLGLAGEAQARGIGTEVPLPEPEEFDEFDEFEDFEEVAAEDESPVDEVPVKENRDGGLFGYRKFW